MNNHLNQNELHLAVEEDPKKLPKERYEHFSACSYCREQYNIQRMVHNSLKKLKPVSAPDRISQKVLHNLVSFSKQAIPKKKTDWIFLLALIVLFTIGSWYLFNGKIGTFFVDSAQQIVPENTEFVNHSNEFVQSLWEKINSIDFNLKTGLNWRTLYVFFGLLAFIFYMILDKKIGHMYKMRRG
jgi:hypothetical protein